MGFSVYIFFHTYVGSDHFFFVQNLEFKKKNGFFRTMNMYVLGYEDFVDIFGGTSQNWTGFRVNSLHFRVFSCGQCTE